MRGAGLCCGRISTCPRGARAHLASQNASRLDLPPRETSTCCLRPLRTSNGKNRVQSLALGMVTPGLRETAGQIAHGHVVPNTDEHLLDRPEAHRGTKRRI